MTESTPNSRSRIRSVATTSIRIVGDLFIITLWVLFLTLLFLSTGWPGWAFYVLLLAGVAVYVTVTATWFGADKK